MDFRILGPLEVLREGRVLPLGGVRPRAALAVLLLHANEVVSTDVLVDRLWGGRPPPTARKALQVHVSRLRKDLGSDVVVTRPPGYLVRVERDELDLGRFERLVLEARSADAQAQARLLREALALWRGPPLADLAYEPFARAEIVRLEELRLAVLEDRIEADLRCGEGARLVAELEHLVAEHPLREGLRGQLMLALYRSGRQAEALDVFQEGRRLLADELGLEPGEPLKELQKAILGHDAALDGDAPAPRVQPSGSLLVASSALQFLPPLLSFAAPLARTEPAREVIVAQLCEPGGLADATSRLRDHRTELLSQGVTARAAAFSSPAPGEDLVRLAMQHEADLLLLDAGEAPLEGGVATVLREAPCDVGLLLRSGGPVGEGSVVVPFGAAEHDWAALELGAWASRALDVPMRLIGAASDARSESRDASRLLADASLIVQRTANVVAEPLLASPGREGVMALARGAGLLVIGLSERWRKEGLGRTRSEIAAAPPAPTVLVRRGLRPGGLAPRDSRTRFTWSMTSAAR